MTWGFSVFGMINLLWPRNKLLFFCWNSLPDTTVKGMPAMSSFATDRGLFCLDNNVPFDLPTCSGAYSIPELDVPLNLCQCPHSFGFSGSWYPLWLVGWKTQQPQMEGTRVTGSAKGKSGHSYTCKRHGGRHSLRYGHIPASFIHCTAEKQKQKNTLCSKIRKVPSSCWLPLCRGSKLSNWCI